MLKKNLHRNLGIILTAVLASGAGLSLADNGRSPRVIRPPDDRVDYFETTATLQGIGDAVCALLGANNLTDNGDGTFSLNAGTLASNYDPLCASEPFADQPSAAACTAALVGSDILVTAGHCLDEGETWTDLNTVYWVFDFAVKTEGVNPAMFTGDQVYRGSEILGLVNDGLTDWAVVKLDRAVTGRTPVGVRSSGALAEGDNVVAIGFGAGLPMKFSDNATVQAIDHDWFEADFDIISGNSGGPIINADTGLIEGVLSADSVLDDFYQDGACWRSTVCPQEPGCDGFTTLASIMNADLQSTIQGAIGGGDNGTGDGDTGAGDPTTDDADGDGVVDEDDFCEDTLVGTQVDGEGCDVDFDDGGEFTSTTGAPCGAAGMISLMFMTLGLAFMRRR